MKRDSVPTQFLDLLNKRQKILYTFEKAGDDNNIRSSEKSI